MKILIIGASGYIGANILKYLSDRGYEIIATSRKWNCEENIQRKIKNVDINLNDVSSYRHFLGEVDVIIYLAGPGAPLRNQLSSMLINEYLTNLAVFLEENAKIKNCPIIFSSSGGTVYGVGKGVPFKESDPLNPVNPYGLLKVLSENLLSFFYKTKSTPYISMRIANPFGGIAHSKVDQGVIDIFARKIFSGEIIEIWGNGLAVRDYIYMEDLMFTFELAINSSDINGAVNIGSGIGSTLDSICSLIEYKSNLKFDRVYKPINAMIIDYSVLDISKAQDIFQWSPRFTLEFGISNLIKNYSLNL